MAVPPSPPDPVHPSAPRTSASDSGANAFEATHVNLCAEVQRGLTETNGDGGGIRGTAHARIATLEHWVEATAVQAPAPGEPHSGATFRIPVYVRPFVRYIAAMAIEAVLQVVLKMPADERAELVERLIDSLSEVELSAEELAQLDDAIADADRAVEQGQLIPADAVLAQMRQIS